jgi:hypothetical protein
VRTLNPDNLDRWISSWNMAVKEPEKLLLGMGVFVNVVQAALGELERRYRLYPNKRVVRGRNSWESKVLGILQRGFEVDAPTIDLWRSEHGEELVNELERCLRGEPITMSS